MSDGEKPRIREAMDKFQKQLVEAGNSPEYARQKAEQCARRVDRTIRERGGMREQS